MNEKEKNLVGELNQLFGRSKPRKYKIYFSISNIEGYNLIVNASESLINSDFFDGNLLEDNITKHEMIPTDMGYYVADLMIHSFQSNHPLDPIEYDCEVWLENVEILHKGLII